MKLTEDEIEAARSRRGGWTRATLQSWGVPWPPPHGWRQALLRGEPIPPGRFAPRPPPSLPLFDPLEPSTDDRRRESK